MGFLLCSYAIQYKANVNGHCFSENHHYAVLKQKAKFLPKLFASEKKSNQSDKNSNFVDTPAVNGVNEDVCKHVTCTSTCVYMLFKDEKI